MATHNMAMLGLALFMMSIYLTMEVSDKDREECQEQLVGLATCLTYVEGNSKAPTPDCCSGLKQVLKVNKKCLCVIIRDRNDPDLGLNINVTLALGLPNVCHAPANVSKCPELLHMAPNSPEAQVFYQFANSSGHSATAPAPTPSGNSMGASSQGPTGSGAQQPTSNGEQRQLQLDMLFSLGLLLWDLLM